MIHYSFACTILLNNYGSINCTGGLGFPAILPAVYHLISTGEYIGQSRMIVSLPLIVV